MRILEKGSIKYEDDPGLSCNSCPCIVELPSGRWIASFMAVPEKNVCRGMKAVFTISDDRGVTWRQPAELFDMPDDNGRPFISRSLFLTLLPSGRILAVFDAIDNSEPDVLYYRSEEDSISIKDTYLFRAFSDDDGESFHSLERINTFPIDNPLPLTGAAKVLKNGDILCQAEENKSTLSNEKWVHKSTAIFSSDNGETFGNPVYITNTPDMYYWDQRMCVLGDGSIIDMFWTLDGRTGQYININARESFDNGRTWGPLWDTGLAAQPGSPSELPDGRLIAITLDRSGDPVIRLWPSADRGRTWGEPFEVYRHGGGTQIKDKTIMNDAWDEMAEFSIGHPETQLLPNGDLLVYFYAGDHKDRTKIHFVRVAP